jgi:glyoxylase-like metal-dependent hydrolase (beta-lactamase superfamily II)
MRIRTYTGGIYDTNSYFIEAHGVLIDAPQGAAAWLEAEGKKVALLLLTHGHIDHVWDAAQVQREHGCQVGYHRDGVPMLTQPDFFKQFGFGWDIAPVRADMLLDETSSHNLGGIDFQILHVPGHCPGSLCFFEKKERLLFGGDVLFAGAIGRFDLPGGDGELLISGIKNKLLPLGDDVKVLPGHGPATTIGHERATNPFLG